MSCPIHDDSDELDRAMGLLRSHLMLERPEVDFLLNGIVLLSSHGQQLGTVDVETLMKVGAEA